MEELQIMRDVLNEPMFQQYLKEATASVEEELALEDKGWINLSSPQTWGIPEESRKNIVLQSRAYATTDPMANQAIRLWTDYSFGEGMSWKAEEGKPTELMKNFWENKENQMVLGSAGQRKSSDKYLIDGEVFFALFVGVNGNTLIRTIDPLEITQRVTLPEDKDTPMLYVREWVNGEGVPQKTVYRSRYNLKGKGFKATDGKTYTPNSEAIVYHLCRGLGARGTPLLYPAHFYFKYQKKFLASRVAIMLALTRFAWKLKIDGGATAVSAAKAQYQDAKPAAGSTSIENTGADWEPIRTDSNSGGAYQDGRMLKLMICSAVGWPEQYFGDLATGNLATAKTVELPVAKMCSSYQKVWADAYQDMCEIIYEKNGVAEDKWYIDFDFPTISPRDAIEMAQTAATFATVYPSFKYSEDIMLAALVSMGINNPAKVLDAIKKESEKRKDEEPEQPVQFKPEFPFIASNLEEATAFLINSLRNYYRVWENSDGKVSKV